MAVVTPVTLPESRQPTWEESISRNNYLSVDAMRRGLFRLRYLAGVGSVAVMNPPRVHPEPSYLARNRSRAGGDKRTEDARPPAHGTGQASAPRVGHDAG